MSNPNLNLLCIGGPKDGERIDLDTKTFRSKQFRIPWLGGNVLYRVAEIMEDFDTVHFVAVADGAGSAIASLIDNYNPKKETPSDTEGKTSPEGTKPGEAKD